METLEWEYAKLNAQRGLTTNYDLLKMKKPYSPIGMDILKLAAKELKEEELKKHIAGFYWAQSVLSDVEQLYIMEYFVSHKYEDEIVDLLGFSNSDSREFKKLKRSAVYKFADFLSLVVKNK